MVYVDKITGEVLPFKTQWTNNPNTGMVSDFGPSKTVSTDFEPLRHMVERVKKGEIHLLGNFQDDLTEKDFDTDKLPLEIADVDEIVEDLTDVEYAKEYAQVLAAETSERSAGNNEAQKEPVQTDLEDYIREKGQASDNGARADDVASVGS